MKKIEILHTLGLNHTFPDMDNQTGHLFEKHSTDNIMYYTERGSNKRLPADYGITGFQAENLPILPATFKLIPRQNKDGKEYKPDPGVLKRLKIIRELFDKCERIVVATDAGREGELIFKQI